MAALVSLSDLACGSGLPSDVPLGGSEAEPETRQRRARAARSNDSARTSEPDEVSEAGESADGAAGAPAEATTDGAATQRAEPASDASAAAGADAAETASECDDSGGSPPSCEELEAGPCATVYGPLCQRLREAIKPKISEPVVRCLEQKNRTSACAALTECLTLGLGASCPTSADEQLCRDTLGRCSKLSGPWKDQQGCTRAVASFKPDAREELARCMKSSCKLEACFLGQQPKGATSTRRRDPARVHTDAELSL